MQPRKDLVNTNHNEEDLKLFFVRMINSLTDYLAKLSFYRIDTAPDLNQDMINIIASLSSYNNTLSRFRQTSKMMDALVEQSPAGQLARAAHDLRATARPPSPFLYYGFFSNDNTKKQADEIVKNNIKIKEEVTMMRVPLSRPYGRVLL
jgi:hypothetical protein